MAEPFLEDKNQNLTVKVRNRTTTLFDGQAKVISSVNETGPFDVLPQHANFITMIQGDVNITLPAGTVQKFEVKTGVLSVNANKVDVYLAV